MSYQKDYLGLTTWYESNNDPFLLCKGSIFGEGPTTGLGIYRFDPFNTSNPLQEMGSFETGISFNCINWADNFEGYKKGIITSALADGSLLMVDAEQVINDYFEGKKTEDNCILTSFELYENGEFYCMEYNQFKSTLLATGGRDLYIVNFERSLQEPDIFSPSQEKTDSQALITSLSWNKSKSVQHILACAQDNGRINIFDFKMKKNIFSFSDGKEHIKGREISIAWNANIPTQLAVAFDEEQSGVQIWDLRNNKAPVKVLNNHYVSKAHALNWSLRQKNLILCADKEGNFIEYNNDTNEYRVETKPDFHTLYARFVPTFDDAFYAVDNEGTLYIHNNNDHQVQELALKNIPFWLQSDFSADINSFNSGVACKKQNNDMNVYAFKIEKTDNEPKNMIEKKMNLVNRNIETAKRDPEILAERLANDSRYDKYILKLIAHSDDSEVDKLKALDIDIESYVKNTEKITGYSYTQESQVNTEKKPIKHFAEISENEALDFFSELAQENDSPSDDKIKRRKSDVSKPFALQAYEEPTTEDLTTISYDLNTNWRRGLESYIKKNIIINNYEGAIDCAIKANRVFEAFMIAHSHPTEREHYLEYLIERFSNQTTDNFCQSFLKPLTQKDYDTIIDSYDTNEWRDILTFIVKTIADKDGKEIYYKKLKDKVLQSESSHHIVKYINLFCNNFDGYVNEILSNMTTNSRKYENLLMDLQVLVLLKLKNKLSTKNELLQHMLIKVCNGLIDNCYVKLAYEFLEILGDDSDDDTLVYKNQLYTSYAGELKLFYDAPNPIKTFKFNFPKAKKEIHKTQSTQKVPSIQKQIKPNPFNEAKEVKKPINIFGQKPKPVIEQAQVKPTPPMPPSKPKIKKPDTMPSPPIQKQDNIFNTGFNQEINKPKVVPPKMQKIAPKPPTPVPPINNKLSTPPVEEAVPSPQNSLQGYNDNKPPAPKPIVQNKIIKPPKPTGSRMAPPPPVHPPKPEPMQAPQLPTQQSHSFQPPQPMKPKIPENKPVPPPPMAKNVPPPPVKTVHKQFSPDLNKIKEIESFVEKAPEFISQIESDQSMAKKMTLSLQQLVEMIKNKSIDETSFNNFYEVINLIGLNDIAKAAALLKKMNDRMPEKYKLMISTLNSMVSALM